MRIEAPCQCALTIAAGKATFTTAFCSLRERLQRIAADQRPRPDAPPPIPRSASHPTSPATRLSPPILKRTRHFYRVRFVFSSARTKTSCWISNIARTLNFCAANHPQQPRRLYCCLHHKQCKYALQEEQNRSLTMRLIHQFSFLRAIHGYVPVRSLSALYFRS